jgi:hypothetical protein
VRGVHRIMLAVSLVSSIAHADVDLVGGYASMTTSLSDAGDASNNGPMLAADAGVHLAPWLSVVGFGSFALYHNDDEVQGSRRVMTSSLGPAVRLHWGNAFAGLGAGLGLWHASFGPDAPPTTSAGVLARLELGFHSEPSRRGWRGMIAGRLARGWFPTAPADSFDAMSGTTTTFEVVAGVAL